MIESNSEREPAVAAFERWLVAGWLLCLPPLIAVACWRSGQPEVLGLWSRRLFGFLAAGAAGYAAAAALIYHPRARKLRGWAMDQIDASRRSRWRYSILLAFPPMLWIAAIIAVLSLGVVPSPIVIGCLANAALLAVWAEMTLLISGRPQREQRLWGMRFLAAGSAAVFTILAIEVGAAVLHFGAYATWEINPKQLNVRFRTGDFDTRVVTNQQGLREPNEIPAAHPGIYRIIVIGDSMTFGWGVNAEQAYPKVTEAVLKKRIDGRAVEVINMGRPGAGPHEYLKYLRKHASKLNPDMVVVGFLIGNDAPVEAPADLKSQQQFDETLERYRNEAHESTADRILTRSLFIRLGYSLLRPMSTRSAASVGVRGPIFGEPNPLGPEAMESLLRQLPDEEEARRRYERLLSDGWIDRGLKWEVNPWLMYAVVKNPTGAADSLAVRSESFEAMQSEWKMASRLLDEMRITTEQDLGAPFVVLSIPNAHLVSQRWVDFLQDRGCIVTDDMTTEGVVNGWMREWCESNRVVQIDPLEEFRRRNEDGEALYLQTDDHMTPAGYQLLGEALAEAVQPLIERDQP